MAAEDRYAPPIPMKICRVSVAPITRIFEKFPGRHSHILSRLKRSGHEIQEVRISPISTSMSPYLAYPMALLRAVPRLKTIRPDVIMADSIEAALVAWMTARAKRVPFVFDFRDNFSFLHRRDSWWYRRLGITYPLERILPRLADQVIAVDDRRRRFCLDAGVRDDRLRLIPNGVDPSFFRPGEKDPDLLERWGLSGRRIILYSGKVNQTYDLQNVIRAMQEVVRKHPDASLLVVGEGKALQELKELSAELGVAEAVVFAKYQPFAEIPGLIRAADVCVYPLRSVAALAIFEYMACGRPVVVPNADYDLSLPEGCCLSVEKNPEGFATGITRLLADPILASRIGAKAREVVEQQFNWDHLAEAYEAALNDAVNGRATRT